MSKLDRFLISDGVFSLFPSIAAVCLDRHLSDHRPILLREVNVDFGPIPFRFFHSWFDYVVFDDMIKSAWSSFANSDGNSMIRFKKKLQDLKSIIRCWIKMKRHEASRVKKNIIIDLEEIDKALDRGIDDDADASRDENSKFFHGVVNKRRSQLAIRGIFVDGVWSTDPNLIKNAFLNHFATRFQEPPNFRFKINFVFPNKLHHNQTEELERHVSHDEIKRAVWDCGDNKSPDDLPNRANISRYLREIDLKISIDLAQKAKVKWAIEGDENSKFFHGIVNKKRRQQAIKGILVDGEWIDISSTIKNKFYHHLANTFADPDRSRVPMEGTFLRCLRPDNSRDLEGEVSDKEIKKAVWDCGSDKSPGLNGFTFEIFKKFWYLISGDVTNDVKEFFNSSTFPNGCNSSFIALIPKVLDAKHLNDFHPISLIGCQDKSIGKILANRPSLVIDDIVSREQSGFIKGRQILDGPLILNEIVSWCKARNEKTLMFKVDFQKALDSVRWDHLNDILVTNFDHFKNQLLSSFQKIPIKLQAPQATIKKTSVELLHAITDSIFQFIDQPSLPSQ
nr:RNA-directed DNA polymerase, eukaryota [Tanacetum cinerariifolium]